MPPTLSREISALAVDGGCGGCKVVVRAKHQLVNSQDTTMDFCMLDANSNIGDCTMASDNNKNALDINREDNNDKSNSNMVSLCELSISSSVSNLTEKLEMESTMSIGSLNANKEASK